MVTSDKEVMFLRKPGEPPVLIPRYFERQARLQELHARLLFCGLDKLYKAAKSLYFWNRMKRDCEWLVSHSPIIKRMRATFSREKRLYPTHKFMAPF